MANQIITSKILEEDPDLIDLVDRFLSRLPEMQANIIKFHDEKHWEMFLEQIHQMKGVGGNYGYPMLTSLCADIETGVKDKNYTSVSDQLIEFNIMCKQILAGREENHKISK